MPDHVMNYIECDAAQATLVEWRRSRIAAAGESKPGRRPRLKSLRSFIPALTPAPAF